MHEQELLTQAELYQEIDRFSGVLAQAQNILTGGGDNAEREAAKAALVGAIFFISRAYRTELSEPLHLLLGALDDLDDGKVRPIVAKAKFHNSPGTPAAVYIFRALVAAIMEFKIMAGAKPGSASADAAAAANRSRHKDEVRISARQVARWRSDLRQARTARDKRSRQEMDGVKQYENTLAAYKQLFPGDPDAAARDIEKALPRFAPKRITQIPPSCGG